jgi:hypothetical protein
MKDCFAYNNGCSALKVNKCPENCKFYKTHQQLRIERQKAYNRLMELGRLDLIDTYDVPKE